MLIETKYKVTRENREGLKRHRSFTLWFTGFSGSGKSTLANAVESQMYRMGLHTMAFDGDNVRKGLCGDLGFAAEDRTENIRRIGELCKLANRAGLISLAAFISPFEKDRQNLYEILGTDLLVVYVKCSLKACEQRDVKGLYKKARAGEIPNFTGIGSPYEPPKNPELTVDTEHCSLAECAQQIIEELQKRNLLSFYPDDNMVTI